MGSVHAPLKIAETLPKDKASYFALPQRANPLPLRKVEMALSYLPYLPHFFGFAPESSRVAHDFTLLAPRRIYREIAFFSRRLGYWHEVSRWDGIGNGKLAVDFNVDKCIFRLKKWEKHHFIGLNMVKDVGQCLPYRLFRAGEKRANSGSSKHVFWDVGEIDAANTPWTPRRGWT